MKTGDATPFWQLKAPHQTVIVKRDTQSLSTAGPFVFIRDRARYQQGRKRSPCHFKSKPRPRRPERFERGEQYTEAQRQAVDNDPT